MPWSVGLLITEVAAMKNDTVKKLKSMRLPAFAEAYEKHVFWRAIFPIFIVMIP